MTLRIRDLHASIDGKQVLRGVNLDIKAGEVHAIMGPNGSGKSTLSYVLAGRPGYTVEQGSVHFEGQDLLALAPEERARRGLFLGFQYPVELPGVNNLQFLRAALNAAREERQEPVLDTVAFMKLAREKAQLVQLDPSLLKRGVNEGFSGGEKKRNEIFQMAVLEPTLAVLDETDSGLDIDALRTVSEGVNALRSPQRSVLLITHYQRLLDYIQPDVVHVFVDGVIVESGDASLAKSLEAKGYRQFDSTRPAQATP